MHTVVVDLRSVVGFESSLALAQGNLTCVVCVCCVVGDEGNIPPPTEIMGQGSVDEDP